jgi:DNA repair protein SbcC/Rad50
MRLHRLALGAIGPFAGTYDLDLEAVAAGGLFLLEGPTGAGKSTVLDAVTFALYGAVSGGAASKDRLHTDFATTTEPFAELEFSVDGARYAVRRSPAHERAKQRGSGTTQVPAAVRLWRVLPDGSREPVSQRVREVDDEVLRLLGGLSAEQFRQVVVLPQGEFATFLRASAEERRSVLQRLFATDHYLAVEQVLAAMRRDAEASVRDAELAVRDELVAVLEAAGVADRDVEDLLGLDRAHRSARLEVLELEITERADAAEAALTAAEHARAGSAERLQADRDRHALVTRRLRAEAALDALEAAHEQVLVARAALAEATRADSVAALLAPYDDAVTDRDLARAAETALAPIAHEGAATDLASRAQERRLEAARLEDALALERDAGARAAELAGIEADLAALEVAVAEHAALLVAAPARIVALRSELDEASLEAGRTDALRQDLARLEERCAAAAALPGALARQERAESAARQAHERDLRAREERLAAFARRIEGMAAELATGLHDGAPCPVCGAVEHPEPAAGAADVPAPDELTELDRRTQDTEAAREVAEAARRDVDTEVAALRATVGDTDPRTERDRVRDALGACVAAEARARSVRARLEDAESDLASRRLALDELAARRAALAERRDERESRGRANEDAVARARGGSASVADRHAALLAEAALLSAHASARARVEAAGQRVGDLERAVLEAARDAGFADVVAARAAVLDPEHRRTLAELVAEHEGAADHARRELADPAVAAVEGELPDLEAAAAALSEAEERRDAAQARAGETRRCRDKVHERRGVLEQLEDATDASRERVRPVIRVADAATGAASVNARRMTLSTYVLRERFESVVAAASRRLESMSDGRYVLVSDESRSGNRKSGLGLAVADQWTGQQRDTATLSGGESFYASLALALGLADTVRDEVGGVELETLFIDEGFGSLDADTLEQVLDVIDALRDGGRVVGIVSHVTELKERIADRIEVRRLTDGSSALAVRC